VRWGGLAADNALCNKKPIELMKIELCKRKGDTTQCLRMMFVDAVRKGCRKDKIF